MTGRAPGRALLGPLIALCLSIAACPASGPVTVPDHPQAFEQTRAKQARVSQARELTLVYQSNLLGEIEPCG